MKIKTSDLIAQCLKDNEIQCVFGIIGAGCAHIFDSIDKLGYTEIISVHHEQAAVMAMGTYYRTCGKLSAAIVTTGAGSANAVTGVVSTWMDSIPGLIISGNEKSIHTQPDNNLRIWGVQGFDSVAMVEKVTKYSNRVMDSEKVVSEINKALMISLDGRPGPCWLDIPMDIQTSFTEPSKITQEETKKLMTPTSQVDENTLHTKTEELINLLEKSKRPIFLAGPWY